ncbi:hypothetical protein yc1106_04331 [Curvularia clavata]|uniref:Heterokaryon incompatibility domain-containing protein n=1 Tax=Curvularia clavata TaxID=95742 RepID=A0A9Q8Z7J3_CURCL|nr:hypothetical protein yc1106_04331 [Curvularia clavata]
MLFNYHPLQPDRLRLLKPVAITQDFLAFEISHHPRTAAPSYTAFSYTWGDGATTEQIVLNAQTFNVDAICIDQNNAEERNAQVRFMDQTYRNAIVVSVWLGLPPIPKFLEAQFANYCKPIKTYEYEGFNWSDSIEDLANRPYWSRFWVVQEFLLGQDVQLYCGKSCMNWSDFKSILGTQTDVHDCFEEHVHYAHSSSGSWTAWPLVTGRHPDKHPKMQQSLYRLLITYETSQCKNPRDRVFALLGLVTAEERVLLENSYPITTWLRMTLCSSHFATFG